MEPRRRISVSKVLMGVAVIAPLGTISFWWLGSLPAHHDPEIGRPVFGNVPDLLVALFYIGVGVFIGLAVYLFALRARNWERGGADKRIGHWWERAKELWRGLSMSSVLEERAAGIMHGLIYYGFIVLMVGTMILELDHLLPGNLKFLEGGFYQIYSAILDVAALALIVGVVWAAVRRWVSRPWRIRGKTKSEDVWILLVLGLIGLTGLATEAARIAMDGRPAFELWSFAGYYLSYLVPATVASGTHQVMWVAHVVTFVAFLVMLPTTKLTGQHGAGVARPAQGGHARDAQPDGGHRHRDGRPCQGGRVHVEAVAGHRCLHRLWALHIGLSGQFHR